MLNPVLRRYGILKYYELVFNMIVMLRLIKSITVNRLNVLSLQHAIYNVFHSTSKQFLRRGLLTCRMLETHGGAILFYLFSNQLSMFFSVLYCHTVLWCVQIIGHIMTLWSYSFVCTSHYLIIIIMHTYLWYWTSKMLRSRMCVSV